MTAKAFGTLTLILVGTMSESLVSLVHDPIGYKDWLARRGVAETNVVLTSRTQLSASHTTLETTTDSIHNIKRRKHD